MKAQRSRTLVRLLLLFYLSVVSDGASESSEYDYSFLIKPRSPTTNCRVNKCECDIAVSCELTNAWGTTFSNAFVSAAGTIDCIADNMDIDIVSKKAPKKCTRMSLLRKEPYIVYNIKMAKDRRIAEGFFRPWHGMYSVILMHMSSNHVLPTKLFHNLTNLNALDIFITPSATPARKTYTLPTDIFKTLGDLQILGLDFTQTANARVSLQQLTGAHFRHLTALKRLKLDTARIGVLPADIFAKLTQLEYLNLRANDLQVLPAKLLDAQRRLLVLDLSENALEYLPADLLKHTTALHQLELNGNRLRSTANIIENIRGLRYLHKLGLRANHLTSVSGAGQTLMSGFKRTEKMTAQVLGKITKFLGTKPGREDYTKTHLDVSGNHISTFDMAWLEGAPNYLNISHNKIKSIHAVKPLAQNENACSVKIEIAGNPLVCDCQLAWAHKNSCIVDLNSVSCSNKARSNSRVLLNYMNKNDLCAWQPAMCPKNCVCVARATSLQITCAGAGLSALPRLPRPEQVALNVTQLDISRNRFSALPLLNSFGYAGVTHLNASHNQITTLTAAQFSQHLKVLDVRHNRLTHLTFQFSFSNYQIKLVPFVQFYFAGNPWRCDCKGADLVVIVKFFSAHILDIPPLYCADRRNTTIAQINWIHVCDP